MADTCRNIPRFFVPELDEAASPVALPPEEAHHAVHVLRVRTGARVQLFDGAGRAAFGEVDRVERKSVSVAIGQLEGAAVPERTVTLGQAWLNHRKSMEAVIRRGTELGVDRFLFFRAAHSERAPKRSDKWTRYAVESCKQCGRNRLPKFDIVPGIDACIAEASQNVLIATTERDPVAIPSATGDCGGVLVLIGPEGDFTHDEIRRAVDEGARPVSLGPNILRSEVAVTVAVALVQHALGHLGPTSD